jgi:hypothetical protein
LNETKTSRINVNRMKQRLEHVSMSQHVYDDNGDARTNLGIRVRPWHRGALYERDDYVRFDGRWFLCRSLTYKSPAEDDFSWKHIEGLIVTK